MDHDLKYKEARPSKVLRRPRFFIPTILDQWMYLLKHTHEMKELSNYLDKRIFSRILEIGELANLTPEEHLSFLTNSYRKRDYDNTMAFAKEKAKNEGIEEGRAVGYTIYLNPI